MNPIVAVWRPGELVTDLAQPNNNGDMHAFIPY
jgi:hypothetical protein